MLTQQDHIDAWRLMVEKTAEAALAIKASHGKRGKNRHAECTLVLGLYNMACQYLSKVDPSAANYIGRVTKSEIDAKTLRLLQVAAGDDAEIS